VSGDDDLRTALAGIRAAKRRELGEAPTPEELLAYRDGLLDAATRESVEARIAVYPEAARALADLAAFPNVAPAPGTPELSDEEVNARWRAFCPKLDELPRSMPPPSVPANQRRPIPWPLQAAAALLLSAGLVTGGYLAGKSSQTDPGPSTARRNATIAELEPTGQDGVRASVEPVQMLVGSEELWLILALPGTEQADSYAGEVLDHHGERLWSGEGLRPTPQGTVHLSIPGDRFSTGTYQIHLLDQAGAHRKPVVSYELRLLEGMAD
jgi:hypothetical protein